MRPAEIEDIPGTGLHRIRTPGGWLVGIDNGTTLVHIEDPAHRWLSDEAESAAVEVFRGADGAEHGIRAADVRHYRATDVLVYVTFVGGGSAALDPAELPRLRALLGVES